MRLTQKELKKRLNYDPITGLFTWASKKSNFSRIKIGAIAGTLDNKGYIIIRLNKKGYKAHRLAFL